MKTRNKHSYLRVFMTLTLCLTFLSGWTQRGYEYENFGNRSVLLNGNVTGSVNDLGAVYYNPARLALIPNPGFLIQGKFYELSNTKVIDLIPEQQVKNSNFTGLPGMIAGKFDFLGTSFYYSSLARNRVDFSIGYNSGVIPSMNSETTPFEEGAFFNLATTVNNKLRDDWFGLTWAYKVKDGFALGATVFASAYNYKGGESVRLTQEEINGDVNIYESNLNFSQSSYGLYFKIAAAWIFEHWELGVNVDFPYLEVFGDSNFDYDEILATGNTLDDFFILEQLKDLESNQKTPLSINVGAGIPWKKHKLHVNLSWYAPLDTYDRITIPELGGATGEQAALLFQEKRRSIVNFGAGAELYIARRISSYLSFSTDFSPLKEADEVVGTEDGIGLSNLLAFDNYHFGGGFNFKVKDIDVVIGAISTIGSQEFLSVRDRPIDPVVPENNTFTIKTVRWRFLLGLNINFRELLARDLKEDKN